MCRIAGIISQRLNEKEQTAQLKGMCNAMAKGGPDGEGFASFSDFNLSFGHRRLSLIDLSNNGKQPMAYGDHLRITYNGEIYNYLELKTDLIAKGYTFQNETDTEVIMAGYQEYGTAFFTLLKGMFAFALLDQHTKKTMLVRDGLGIKPLYYYQQDQELYFASEVKAFKVLDPEWPTNENWPIYFLAFGFIPEPFTTLKNVLSLPKGHYMVWDHEKLQSEINQFAPDYPTSEPTSQDAAEKTTKTLLDQAVKRHLIADAPIGVFLSGGIDSSLLALIAEAQTKQTVTTVSINFNEPAFSEQEFQEIIAKKINSKHISYIVTPEDFATHMPQIFEDMDQPSNDGINSWFVNKVAKENGLKAVLSGIGADEIYGGYPSFKRHEMVKKLKQLPKLALKLAKNLPSDKLKRISYLAYDNPIGEYLFLRGFYTPNIISKLLQLTEKQVNDVLSAYPMPQIVAQLNAEDRISWFEMNIYMQNQLLKDTDYMSMAHGVEVRVPFLDQDLIAHALKLPTDVRFNGAQPKSLLIKAYQTLLPEAIWNRPKKGFTFPFQHWFKTYEPMQNEAHYQQNPEALRLLTQFRNNKLHWSKLFAVYQVFHHGKRAS